MGWAVLAASEVAPASAVRVALAVPAEWAVEAASEVAAALGVLAV